LRAVMKQHEYVTNAADAFHRMSLEESLAAYSAVLSANPWLHRYPFMASAVVPIEHAAGGLLVAETKQCVRMHPRFQHFWTLMALSGGHAVDVFGEWNGNVFMPIAMRAEKRIHEFES